MQKDENSEELIRGQKLKLKEIQGKVDKVEGELIQAKQKLGEIMNAVSETGHTDLIDQIYSIAYG